ncbi:helix-turn-helix domain-containing protein [Paenibacillus sanguinis]|uniref:helix-turn-helix domain-containing protein n=1 Tax=Paenibacillus sanguinis TaxID=225906 RepID=UPI0003616564|nr:helix-turn-helix domain-containing protein [Paenibacillus sanguinis]
MDINQLSEFSIEIQRMISQRFLADLLGKTAWEGLRLVNNRDIFCIPEPCRSDVAIALIDTHASTRRSYEDNSIRQAAYTYLQEQYGHRHVLLRTEEGMMICLFPSSDRLLWTNIYEELRLRFPLPLSIGVGLGCEDLSSIRESYDQALQVLREKFIKGFGVYYYNTQLNYNQQAEYPSASEKAILEQFFNHDCDPEAIISQVHSFYSTLYKGGVLEVETVYSVTLRLLVSIEQSVYGTLKSEAFPGLPLFDITQAGLLTELEARVTELILKLHQIYTQWKPQNDQDIVNQAILYMKNDLAGATLQNIGSKVFVTPNYLSLLFKNRTGKTFIDTLTDLRMEEAKRQIRTSHRRYAEISRLVGYQDPRYFGKLFKQRVGMTPSEYKEQFMAAYA